MDQTLPPVSLAPISPLKRIALVAVGTVTLGIGIAGMFLPGVPTTVFLLITMACYVRSSDRLYRWVMTRTWLQKPIKTALDFQQSGTLPVRIKLVAQAVAWSSFVLVVFTGARPVFEVITFLLASSCTVAMSIIKSEGRAFSPRTWGGSAGEVALQLWLGAQAGALAGLIWGIGEQTIVRFVARLAGVPLETTLQSILLIVLGAIAVGALFGLLYAALRRVLPRNKWLNGALFGVLMLAVTGLAAYAAQTGSALFSAGWQAVGVVLLVVLFMAAGVIMCMGYRSLEMRAR
jgi:uncharacterized membrane protein YbaN (DUF454 family)